MQRRRNAEDRKLQRWQEKQEEERMYQEMQEDAKLAEDEEEKSPIVSGTPGIAITGVPQQAQPAVVSKPLEPQHAATRQTKETSEPTVLLPSPLRPIELRSPQPMLVFPSPHKLSPFQREQRRLAGTRSESVALLMDSAAAGGAASGGEEEPRPKTVTHSPTHAPPPAAVGSSTAMRQPISRLSGQLPASVPARRTVKGVLDEARSFAEEPPTSGAQGATKHNTLQQQQRDLTLQQILEQSESTLEKKLAVLRHKSRRL